MAQASMFEQALPFFALGRAGPGPGPGGTKKKLVFMMQYDRFVAFGKFPTFGSISYASVSILTF